MIRYCILAKGSWLLNPNRFHKNTLQIEIAHETKTIKTDLQNRNRKKKTLKRKTTSKLFSARKTFGLSNGSDHISLFARRNCTYSMFNMIQNDEQTKH